MVHVAKIICRAVSVLFSARRQRIGHARFLFEKISPPDRRESAAPAANEPPRSPMVRMLERFVGMRPSQVERKHRREQAARAVA